NTLVRRQPGPSTGGMIFFSAFIFLIVFVVGLWYAVGKSLVFDYGAKMAMEDLYKAMVANKVTVSNYPKQKQEWPTTWEQVQSANGKNPMNSIDSMTQLIVKDVHLEGFGAMVAAIDLGDKVGTLRLAPHRVGNTIGWTCNVSADIVRYAPEACAVKE